MRKKKIGRLTNKEAIIGTMPTSSCKHSSSCLDVVFSSVT